MQYLLRKYYFKKQLTIDETLYKIAGVKYKHFTGDKNGQCYKTQSLI
jgi:hypothetical protein